MKVNITVENMLELIHAVLWIGIIVLSAVRFIEFSKVIGTNLYPLYYIFALFGMFSIEFLFFNWSSDIITGTIRRGKRNLL